MKKILPIIQFIVLLVFAFALIWNNDFEDEGLNEIIFPEFEDISSDVSIMVASDIHFLSKKNTTINSFINRPDYSGDGRIVVYNEELVDAFIDEVLTAKPDVLLLTGDLTIDGSYSNHLELSKKLEQLIKVGITVLVIPGNHDLNNISSCKYLDKTVEPIRQTMAVDFKKIYAKYGYENALIKDSHSLSYAYQLNRNVLFLMLDTCIYEDGNPYATRSDGVIYQATIPFIEHVLKYANKYHLDVISCTHHNLLTHSTLFDDGFRINNNEEILNLYHKYKVKLNLSGHMHIQHIVDEKSLTEILTSSLAVSYNQYGIINYIPHQKMTYQTKIVDVSSYYKKLNSKNMDLLDFYNYSLEFFEDSSYEKTYNSIMFSNSSLSEYALACATTQKILNPAYFSGVAMRYKEEILSSPLFSEWNRFKNEMHYFYFWSILNDANQLYTQKTITLT